MLLRCRALTIAAALFTSTSMATADDLQCPLDAPKAVVKPSAKHVRSHSFGLAEARRGIERIVLTNGARFEIGIQGCEYHQLIVRYEASGRAPAAADTRAGYRAAADALEALASTGVRTVFDLARAARLLRDAAVAPTPPERAAELAIDDAGIPSQAVVRDWGAAGRGRRFVALDLIWGPA